ncbi:hypothetical protein PENTCL1PPCAC_20017, partial [Pristionchus entomophagus]
MDQSSLKFDDKDVNFLWVGCDSGEIKRMNLLESAKNETGVSPATKESHDNVEEEEEKTAPGKKRLRSSLNSSKSPKNTGFLENSEIDEDHLMKRSRSEKTS